MPGQPKTERPSLLRPWKTGGMPKHLKMAYALLASGLVLAGAPILLWLVVGLEANSMFGVLLFFGPMFGVLSLLIGLLSLSPLEYLRTFGAKPTPLHQKKPIRRNSLPVRLSLILDGETAWQEWGELELKDGLLRFSGTSTKFAIPARPVKAAEGVAELNPRKRSIRIAIEGTPVAELELASLHREHADDIENLLAKWKASPPPFPSEEIILPSLVVPRHKNPLYRAWSVEFGLASLVFLAGIALLPPVLHRFTSRGLPFLANAPWHVGLGMVIFIGLAAAWVLLKLRSRIDAAHSRQRDEMKERRRRQGLILTQMPAADQASMKVEVEGDARPGINILTHGP